jgi:hypothetical protein
MAYEYESDFYGYANDDAATWTSEPNMTKKMKRELAEMNKDDIHFFQVKRQVKSNSSEMVGIFGSGDIGSSIRDAVTGIRNYAHKVGSASENLYFKARICSGELGKDTPTLFFESPEQYERHMYTKLDNNTKMKWHLKYQAARREQDDNAVESRNLVVLNGQEVTLVK